MGTSSNQPSPNTPNWQIARATLGNAAVSVNRQATELWKAALGDRGDSLRTELGDSLLASACKLANEAGSPSEAMRLFQKEIGSQHASGLFLDLGKRALARAVAANHGALGFARELFAEVTSYYASRDLPSIVARPRRVQNVSQSIELKTLLRDHARNVAARVGEVRTDPEGWKVYVSNVVDSLRSGRPS